MKKSITDTLRHSGKSDYRRNEITKIQKRMMMLLHEYQAQGLLKKYSLPIPKVNFKIKNLIGRSGSHRK